MKIAFVSRNDVNNIESWSGTDYHTFQALRTAGEKKNANLYLIHKLYAKRNKVAVFFEKVIRRLMWKIFSTPFINDFYRWNVKFLARQVKKELTDDIDVIFSMTSWPITYLKSDKIKVFISDGEIGDYIALYSHFKNLSKRRVKAAIKMREDAINNSHLVLLTSEWAANATISRYGSENQHKIKIVSFGANIECSRTSSDITKIIENKEKAICYLLFVGVNWGMKGGNIALETAKILHERGVKVHLDIVGIKKCPVELPEYVKDHGFISKSTDEGKRKINDLYEKAHFFILPTRFDCYGIVFCEASSFGVPSLATKIAGVPSVVIEGKNGKLFELSDKGEKYAEYIQTIFADYENYKKLCYSSFEQYETRLNWKTSGEKILNYIEELYVKGK